MLASARQPHVLDVAIANKPNLEALSLPHVRCQLLPRQGLRVRVRDAQVLAAASEGEGGRCAAREKP